MERITEYTNAEEEAPADIPGSCPDGWPSKGEVPNIPTFLKLCVFFVYVCLSMPETNRADSQGQSLAGNLADRKLSE